jgi:hypothetical protein
MFFKQNTGHRAFSFVFNEFEIHYSTTGCWWSSSVHFCVSSGSFCFASLKHLLAKRHELLCFFLIPINFNEIKCDLIKTFEKSEKKNGKKTFFFNRVHFYDEVMGDSD